MRSGLHIDSLQRLLEEKPFLFLLVLVLADLFFLGQYTSAISISGHEAKIVYLQETILHDTVIVSMNLFGWDDLGLRIPFLFIHAVNAVLIYFLSKRLLRKPADALFATLVYLMLPGVNSAALLISKAGFLITCVLVLVLILPNYRKLSLALLCGFMILDNAFAVLYLALFFYALYKKDNVLIVLSLLMFAVNMYIFGFDDGGKPKGYFLDTFGVYSVIFSPLVFIYFFYSIYRTLVKEEKTILWFIVFVTFAFSLMLSFRQKIRIEDFAPLFVIGAPLMIRTFLHGYRVRLPQFRKKYRMMFQIVISSLILNFIFIFWNKPLYHLYDENENHFAYHSQVAKELATQLKEKGFEHLKVDNTELALRLKFYGIESGKEYLLSDIKLLDSSQEVSIFYTSEKTASFYVTKILN